MAMTAPAAASEPLDERELCTRLFPAIRAFARRRLRGAAAEDFAQDALVVLVGAFRAGRIEDLSRAGAFALGICRHLAADRARIAERRRELLETYGATALVADEPAWEQPATVARDHLEDCLSQLTRRARDVIRATFFEEVADAAIAEAMSLTAQNVRVIRHRSLAALRECLDKPVSWSVR
jgi:RNA polymerase sigma-70 factor (ECF subfamily)